ncbi:MAG: helix-turn-helix domain-containing protein [Planctomycetaceae bacterium]|nr:helix-turn-helix domain-containing protein [Planctomycetaceae bacterium]
MSSQPLDLDRIEALSISIQPTALLTRTEAAQLLGVKPQTLAVWASTGRYELPLVKCGRTVRYRQSDLQAWMDARTVTHTGQLAE